MTINSSMTSEYRFLKLFCAWRWRYFNVTEICIDDGVMWCNHVHIMNKKTGYSSDVFIFKMVRRIIKFVEWFSPSTGDYICCTDRHPSLVSVQVATVTYEIYPSPIWQYPTPKTRFDSVTTWPLPVGHVRHSWTLKSLEEEGPLHYTDKFYQSLYR